MKIWETLKIGLLRLVRRYVGQNVGACQRAENWQWTMVTSKRLEILCEDVDMVGHRIPGRKFGEFGKLGHWDRSESMLKKCRSVSERVGPPKVRISAKCT